MTDRPVIFSAPMIRALLDGRKTQTRRVAWGGPISGLYESDGGPLTPILRATPWQKAQPGDRLWVRESGRELSYAYNHGSERDQWAVCGFKYSADGAVIYRDGEWHDRERPRPSIHMPRWASRLTLVVTAVKFELLQDISEEDALAEGITSNVVIIDAHCAGGVHTEVTATRYFYDGCDDEGFESSGDAYAALWDKLHDDGAWDRNPGLVALTFAVNDCNIDQMPTAKEAS